MSTEIKLEHDGAHRFKNLERGAIFSTLSTNSGFIYVKNNDEAIMNCVGFSRASSHPFSAWIGPDQHVSYHGAAADYVFSVRPKTKKE